MEVEGHHFFGLLWSSFESELSGCIKSNCRKKGMSAEHLGRHYSAVRRDFDRHSHRSAELHCLGYFGIMGHLLLHGFAVRFRLLRRQGSSGERYYNESEHHEGNPPATNDEQRARLNRCSLHVASLRDKSKFIGDLNHAHP